MTTTQNHRAARTLPVGSARKSLVLGAIAYVQWNDAPSAAYLLVSVEKRHPSYKGSLSLSGLRLTELSNDGQTREFRIAQADGWVNFDESQLIEVLGVSDDILLSFSPSESEQGDE